uniref:Myb/SANT-like domain-containing protein n=1 Tax=Ananas comosus var. bracteatus TaxID=296719 RepID=A0A6V7Q2J3_ANACO|nr:unnamed protein product [Ananas comosus var. bracteatus]
MRTRTANWTDHIDSILLSILMEDHALENYVGGSFTRVAWIRIVEGFNTQIGQNLSKKHISNRLKVLKGLYMLYDKLANLSGWGWDSVNNIPTAGDPADWDAVIALAIHLLPGLFEPGSTGNPGNEIGRPDISSHSPSPHLVQPTVGGSASGSRHSSAGKRPRSPPPSAQPRKHASSSDGRKKKSDLGAMALAEMVEIGKQKLELARKMYHHKVASRSTIPTIEVCMNGVYNIVGTTNVCALAAGDSLRDDKSRQLFMTMTDELAVVWINRQVDVHNVIYRPDFPGLHDDLRLETDFYACLPLCSFAHACEGRSPQAGTPEIAIATHARPCGIGRRNRMSWGRLIPRVGMLTTTGPLGTAQAGLPTGRSYEIWNKWNQFVNEQFDNDGSGCGGSGGPNRIEGDGSGRRWLQAALGGVRLGRRGTVAAADVAGAMVAADVVGAMAAAGAMDAAAAASCQL